MTADPLYAISDLDLSKVGENVRRRYGWTKFQTAEAEADYRRFLYLIYLYPLQTIVPWSKNLDLFWHEHILDTAKYADDCRRLFGKFVHHNPNIRLAAEVESSARLETARLFVLHFPPGEDRPFNPTWVWPSAATMTAIVALNPAVTRPPEMQKRRRKKNPSSCAAPGCGGGTGSGDSSGGASCGTSCSGGGCGGGGGD